MILKISIDSSRQYSICSCGLSKNLPYCDNAHRDYNKHNNTNYKSVKVYLLDEEKIKISCSNWNEDE